MKHINDFCSGFVGGWWATPVLLLVIDKPEWSLKRPVYILDAKKWDKCKAERWGVWLGLMWWIYTPLLCSIFGDRLGILLFALACSTLIVFNLCILCDFVSRKVSK